MASIDHGDDLVCIGGDFLRGLGQLGVGDRLAIMGQQAFDATIDRRVPIAGAVSREVNEAATALAGALAQLTDFLKDVFFGGVLVAHQSNLVGRNAHGHGHPFGALDVVWHALQGGRTCVGTILAQANHQCGAQTRCLCEGLTCYEPGQSHPKISMRLLHVSTTHQTS